MPCSPEKKAYNRGWNAGFKTGQARTPRPNTNGAYVGTDEHIGKVAEEVTSFLAAGARPANSVMAEMLSQGFGRNAVQEAARVLCVRKFYVKNIRRVMYWELPEDGSDEETCPVDETLPTPPAPPTMPTPPSAWPTFVLYGWSFQG